MRFLDILVLLSWISAKLALIWSKMHLQLNSFPFLPPASHFTALWLGYAQKSKFWTRKWPMSLGFSIFGIFFRLPVFSFSFLFAAVIDLLLGLLAVKKLLRKRHQDGQILAWSSQVKWQQILVFRSTFWAFLCISKAPFGRSLWSGHHWKDLFLLQKWSVDDANFGQKRWRKKWKKGQGLSRVVIGGTGVNGLNNRVFLSRNYLLIVAPQKFDVVITNICKRSEALRANMLVLRRSNFQGATIRPIVPRHKHSIVFIIHHQIFP